MERGHRARMLAEQERRRSREYRIGSGLEVHLWSE
jgi:hypothetical protein